MAIHESGEMYLETILILSKENPHLRAIDVGEYMGFSKPSVSRGLSILKQNGYVIADENGFLSLTESGREIAEKIYERHETITKALLLLGVSPESAQEDACRIEHVISDETFEAIKRTVNK